MSCLENMGCEIGEPLSEPVGSAAEDSVRGPRSDYGQTLGLGKTCPILGSVWTGPGDPYDRGQHPARPAPCRPDRLDRAHLILTSGATPPGGRRVRHFAPPKGGFRGVRATTEPRFGGVESRLDGEHVSRAPYSGARPCQWSCRADGE